MKENINEPDIATAVLEILKSGEPDLTKLPTDLVFSNRHIEEEDGMGCEYIDVHLTEGQIIDKIRQDIADGRKTQQVEWLIKHWGARENELSKADKETLRLARERLKEITDESPVREELKKEEGVLMGETRQRLGYMEPVPTTDFEVKLDQLLKEYEQETGDDVPDFILAQYMRGCLKNYMKSLQQIGKHFYGHPL